MITVEAALEIVESAFRATKKTEEVMLKNALHRVLFEGIPSPISMPPFQQSAMDGYAVQCSDKQKDFLVVGEVAAGEMQSFTLKANEAVRIFTGAEVPESANMVIRQEDVTCIDKKLVVHQFPKEQANIRPMGEQILKGGIALHKGHKINSASIGFLASLGIERVKVYQAPKIAILSTGDELVQAGESLKSGQIYDSNSVMIKTALASFGYSHTEVLSVKDNYNETVNAVAVGLENYDILICSGGISVGDYDFIGRALAQNEVNTHFYKVKQKPGKPLYFGQKHKTFIFGLPGNPAACLTCLYIYILPGLEKYQGGGFSGLSCYQAELLTDYSRKGDRAEFLKSEVVDRRIQILDGQSSAMMQSFAVANALLYLPIDRVTLKAGEKVTYFKLP